MGSQGIQQTGSLGSSGLQGSYPGQYPVAPRGYGAGRFAGSDPFWTRDTPTVAPVIAPAPNPSDYIKTVVKEATDTVNKITDSFSQSTGGGEGGDSGNSGVADAGSAPDGSSGVSGAGVAGSASDAAGGPGDGGGGGGGK